jgi:predicted esterase
MAAESRAGLFGQGPRVPPGKFPEPVDILPTLEHRQTFIILHGRGSTAAKFGPPLLATTTLENENIQTAFPHAKLVFLTASWNRATIYKKSLTHQWFDGWYLDRYTERQEMMRDGLHKSCKYIHGILEKEIEIIGAKNVVLWGLSQGCATSLSSLLTWDGKQFAATVGMCGYLPFGNHVEDISKPKKLRATNDPFGTAEEEEDSDPFSHSGGESDNDDIFSEGKSQSNKGDLTTQAVKFFREELDMEEKKGMVFQQVLVFLGHGTADEKVDLKMGKEARRCLDQIGIEVEMVEYPDLGHWYSPEMLSDIFTFLRNIL